MKYILNLTIVFNPSEKILMELNDEERAVTLSNPATRLLLEFIKHQNQPIEREVLLKNVWEDYGFTASNSNLNAYVSELRKALTALGENPQVITTIPKHGFQFTARIESILSTAQPELDTGEERYDIAAEHSKEISATSQPNTAALMPTIAPLTREVIVPGRKYLTILRSKILLILVILSVLGTALKIYANWVDVTIGKANYLLSGEIDQCQIFIQKNATFPAEGGSLDMARRDLKQEKIDCSVKKHHIFYTKGSDGYKINQLTFIGICIEDEQGRYNACRTIRINSGEAR
ncbi:transcriptional regulator [Yersinia sp. 1652 StPb PI]|uniref:winged helix-turn-helix domain-containing protein n=1 Tax=unclassified Yersinia (in: enterobacteria) TaxID=2653513 RepID=UPI00355B6DFC